MDALLILTPILGPTGTVYGVLRVIDLGITVANGGWTSENGSGAHVRTVQAYPTWIGLSA